MKFKEFFKGFVQNVYEGVSRFMFAFVLSVIWFLAISVEIYHSFDLAEHIIIVMPLSIVVSVFLTVVSEKTRLSKKLACVLSAVATVASFLTEAFRNYDAEYFYMGNFGIMIALVCFTLCMLFDEKNDKVIVPYIVKNTFFTVFVSGILSIGISICLWAFQVLIYDFDSELYGVLLSFIWCVGTVNLFLAYLPKKGENIQLPKVFKTVVSSVALPIYIVLMAILYAYILKIIITWKMPVGQINWFASYATLFFVFFVFCVRQYEDKFPKLFTKLIPYFIIPVVIVQLVAIYQRISAYGLTTPRTVSLILVAIGIIFAVVSIFRRKMENVLWVVGVIVLLFTLVPTINIIDMPKASQVKILEDCLLKNNMLVDGKIVPNSQVEEEDREVIRSAYGYLRSSAGKLPDWCEKKYGSDEFKALFGFEEYEYPDSNYEYYSFQCDDSAGKIFDIDEFNAMQFVSYYYNEDYPLFESSINGVHRSYDMVETFEKIVADYGHNEIIEPIKLDENTTLYLDYSSLEMKDGEFDHLSFGGYLFVK